MSIEFHVFFHGEPPSRSSLRRRLKELGFPFSLEPAKEPLETQSGYLPMTLRGSETGVELYFSRDKAAIRELAEEAFDPSFDWVASFRWGGDELEMVAGLCAAAALATMTAGVVLDSEAGAFLSAEEAINVARRHFSEIAKSARAPGTRPADIKRYLKPLLEERDDLALIGRMLVIRPVRHILRGAFLDRTGDKYSFRIWRYIKFLHENPQGLGYGHALLGSWKVFEPYFQPHLLDTLATEIFDAVGPINSLDAFAHALEGDDRAIGARSVALALAGQQERALALLEEGERSPKRFNGYWQEMLKNQRLWLDRDIKLICAELHDREAKAVKELKLEKVWEPSPFPVERDDEGARACDEPAFTTDRWPPRPPDLIADPLASEDDVQFGIDIVSRAGRTMILRPLSFDDAKRRHDNCEAYAIAVRMRGDRFLFLRFWTGYSAYDPDRVTRTDYLPTWSIQLRLPTRLGVLIVQFSGNDRERGALELQSLRVKGDDYNIFHASNDTRERSVSVHDYRSGEQINNSRAMTDGQLSICRFAPPAFGDAEALLRRVAAYLPGVGLDADLADRADDTESWRSAGPIFHAFYSI